MRNEKRAALPRATDAVTEPVQVPRTKQSGALNILTHCPFFF